MAGVRVKDAKLKSLQKKVVKLVSTAESLTTLLDQEADRLKKKDEVARLKLLRSAILQQAEWERGREIASSSGYNLRKLAGSVIGIGLLIIAQSQNKKMLAAGDSLLAGPAGGERTFKTVLIRIVAKGLPDGVDVVSISNLGRKSKQKESEVINRLKKDGCLLLSEERFSRLIEKLAEEILKGRLTLPISIQTLSQILTPYPLRFIHQNKG